MSDSDPSPNPTWEAIKEVVDPLDRISRSAARTHEIENGSFAIGLEDARATLAEVRRKERARVKIDPETGLMHYEDVPEAEMGDLHIGPRIEVKQVERDGPKPQQVIQTPRRNGGSTIGKLVVGALAATGLLGAGGLGAALVLNAINKPQPVVKEVEKPVPVEPPKTTVRIR